MTQEHLIAIAQEYGIVPEFKKRGGSITVSYKHGERVYGKDIWGIVQHQDEFAHRQGFAWIVQESRRLDALLAQEDELVAQARSGDQEARERLVDMCVERIEANTQTSMYNRQVREAVHQRIDEVLADCYPFGKMHHIARATIVVIGVKSAQILR